MKKWRSPSLSATTSGSCAGRPSREKLLLSRRFADSSQIAEGHGHAHLAPWAAGDGEPAAEASPGGPAKTVSGTTAACAVVATQAPQASAGRPHLPTALTAQQQADGPDAPAVAAVSTAAALSSGADRAGVTATGRPLRSRISPYHSVLRTPPLRLWSRHGSATPALPLSRRRRELGQRSALTGRVGGPRGPGETRCD